MPESSAYITISNRQTLLVVDGCAISLGKSLPPALTSSHPQQVDDKLEFFEQSSEKQCIFTSCNIAGPVWAVLRITLAFEPRRLCHYRNNKEKEICGKDVKCFKCLIVRD
jgi:hypothetical protein